MFSNIRLFSKQLLIESCKYSNKVAKPLRSKKAKASKDAVQHFVDLKQLRAVGGSGGDGCISFLSTFLVEHAGPDGGDGGNGGHVIFQSTYDVKDLSHVPTVIKAPDGEKGRNVDCHGKNAQNHVVKVPVGSVVKNSEGKVIGDLYKEGLMFVAARGGAGGRGNHYFATDTEQTPKIGEYGAEGEDLRYTVEIRSMAHVGLIGFPNAGKSTLLRAITRARPKVAPYPFTTIKPHVGIVQYDDYEQVAVADLPGIIPESHKNKGLGIQFLKHAERCMALLYIVDISLKNPWDCLHTLQFELSQFSDIFKDRPQLVIANKIDIAEDEQIVEDLRQATDLPVIPISAKTGKNVVELLEKIKIIYDENKSSDLRNKT